MEPNIKLDQEVVYLPIEGLILWSENPRDSIDENANNQTIADLAISDVNDRWELKTLAKQMGEHYDYSELPTVVYHGKKPVVYDGNRRVILAMLALGNIKPNVEIDFNLPKVEKELPCNVCKKQIALINVYRKHANSGSWKPLERDIFMHKYLGEPKSPLLKLDDATGIITQNPHLNKGFVKKEIFNAESLKKLGFDVDGETIKSKHKKEEVVKILEDISEKVRDGVITTRDNRGKIEEVLNKDIQDIIAKNIGKPRTVVKTINSQSDTDSLQRQAPKTKKEPVPIFDGRLYLKKGSTNDLYRDIAELYAYFASNRTRLSISFINIIRMSLRLLCEVAANEKQSRMDNFLNSNYDDAKNVLSQDRRTLLSNQNVTKESIVQLLQTGAHGYTASTNLDQTIALSVIIGAILRNVFGKGE